ncbi:MAG TPA: hypothetical protein GXX33_03395 [Firmicutes bacterium]|nr:hypothetical protein [Bacillota bacterium]
MRPKAELPAFFRPLIRQITISVFHRQPTQIASPFGVLGQQGGLAITGVGMDKGKSFPRRRNLLQ